MTSNSCARRATVSNCMNNGTKWSFTFGSRRKALGHIGASVAFVTLSPDANSVTSCPSSTRASVRYATTRSVPPYNFGGTASVSGATCAIFMCSPPVRIDDGTLSYPLQLGLSAFNMELNVVRELLCGTCLQESPIAHRRAAGEKVTSRQNLCLYLGTRA